MMRVLRGSKLLGALLVLSLVFVLVQVVIRLMFNPHHSTIYCRYFTHVKIDEDIQTIYREPMRCHSKAQGLHAVTSSERLDDQFDTWHWDWIKNRIHNLWPHWMDARRGLEKQRFMQGRRGLRILVIPGVLTQTPFAKSEYIQQGGALGDILQWADLITCLHLLGHNVTLMHDLQTAFCQLRELYLSNHYNSCNSSTNFDLIFTDYLALSTLSQNFISKIKCRLRVLDIFGTEPAYNSRQYIKIPKDHPGYDLDPKQYFTSYPHTPDNSFAGFCVPPARRPLVEKKNIALLYGKSPKYFQGLSSYIRHVAKTFEIHATFSHDNHDLGDDVINHGHMTGDEYRKLMERAKVLVGGGHPMEGSGALEALSRGMAFIQPLLAASEAARAFQHKPTSRQPHTQVPYLDQFIGPPYVYTININNHKLVDRTLQTIARTKLEQFIPREFSMEGMLERLAVLLEKQDFCDTDAATWPPVSEARLIMGNKGQGCVKTCHTNDMVCEPAFFSQISGDKFQRQGIHCKGYTPKSDIYHPSYHKTSRQCYIQEDPILYSCAGGKPELTRLCPCRQYIKHQVALCKSCLD